MSLAILAVPAASPAPAELRDSASDGPLFEIIDGKKVDLPAMSIFSSFVASDLIRHLGNFATEHKLGRVIGEALFDLPFVFGRMRRPDVAFVSYNRWGEDRPLLAEDDAAWDIAPDLAIEVVSPSDKASELITKVIEYFKAGVRLVWVIYPRQRYAVVHESLTIVRGVTADGALEGGSVLPGFALPLAQLLPETPGPT